MVGERDIQVGLPMKHQPTIYNRIIRVAIAHLVALEDLPTAPPSTPTNGPPGLEELDLVLRVQFYDRLLPVRQPAVAKAVAPLLAVPHLRSHFLDAHIEQLLDG